MAVGQAQLSTLGINELVFSTHQPHELGTLLISQMKRQGTGRLSVLPRGRRDEAAAEPALASVGALPLTTSSSPQGNTAGREGRVSS